MLLRGRRAGRVRGFSRTQIARIFDDRDAGLVAIVDDAARPLGVVSKSDLVRERQRFAAGATARGVMFPLVLEVGERATIADAAALMSKLSVHQLSVVDDGGAVTALDVVRRLDATRTGRAP